MTNFSKIKSSTIDSLSKPISFSDKLVNPKRDWNILKILLVVFVISAAGFDFYMYQKIISGDMYISVKKEELIIENLKSNDLQKILENFQSKKVKIKTVRVENMIDPSL